MNVVEFRELVFSFPGVEEKPHFDRTAFRVINKKIFASLYEASETANLKLSLVEQATFTAYDKDIVYAVANKWGQQGWTTFELKNMPVKLMQDALESAYKDVF